MVHVLAALRIIVECSTLKIGNTISVLGNGDY